MPYLALENGQEVIFDFDESRASCTENCKVKYNFITLKAGDIEKLTGRKLKAGDEPIKYTTD